MYYNQQGEDLNFALNCNVLNIFLFEKFELSFTFSSRANETTSFLPVGVLMSSSSGYLFSVSYNWQSFAKVMRDLKTQLYLYS